MTTRGGGSSPPPLTVATKRGKRVESCRPVKDSTTRRQAAGKKAGWSLPAASPCPAPPLFAQWVGLFLCAGSGQAGLENRHRALTWHPAEHEGQLEAAGDVASAGKSLAPQPVAVLALPPLHPAIENLPGEGSGIRKVMSKPRQEAGRARDGGGQGGLHPDRPWLAKEEIRHLLSPPAFLEEKSGCTWCWGGGASRADPRGDRGQPPWGLWGARGSTPTLVTNGEGSNLPHKPPCLTDSSATDSKAAP